ncbi:hypothetical protein [Chondromyces crocatus]|uniref:Transposase (putative) YhgA-like domain-containing protein n=1 Tax=Chondromyces crocatus TaxID=52 RepID=A0A0K1EJS5_CHOCO|nr:hypothetical protein [Chondromyces crocatus]AKT40853.1 uncharacterized protein CMC5_050080 [Chondromyces crocatus]
MSPSLQHSALVQIFRDRPELLPRLLREPLGVHVPHRARVTVVESTLDQLQPIEYRADLVAEIHDAAGDLVLAVVVEVQLSIDPDKRYVWPVYTTVLRARKRCPVLVLVVTPSESVGAWAAQPIPLGPELADGHLRPRVLGPAQLPRITDSAVASLAPELGVLSALAHGNRPDGLPVVMAALRGLERLEEETASVYFQVMHATLREPVRRALEAVVIKDPILLDLPTPPFLFKLFAKQLDEARAEGLKAGKVEGLKAGKVEGLREVLVEVATRAGVPLTSAARARVEGCDDVDTLKRWIDNALTARSAEELLA